MSDSALQSNPVLVTSSTGLAVAHGPGVVISHHSGPYPFLADGCTFVKYHQQPSLFNHSGSRLVFSQHNTLLWIKPGVSRPRPGEEHTVDPQYQAPLTAIVSIQAGKQGKSFTQVTPTQHSPHLPLWLPQPPPLHPLTSLTVCRVMDWRYQSKQAAAVPEERAWSLLVRRADGKEELVDFAASSREERDKWVHALQSLVATAKRTVAERDSRVRLVDVGYRVDQHGQVTLTMAPAAALSDSHSNSTSPATAATSSATERLTVATGTASSSRAKTEHDTPSPIAPQAANHIQHTTSTATTGLQDADSRLKAALEDNERLKERIAELEEQLKGSHVDSVSAS